MYGKGPYTEDIINSPRIAEPFHLLDLCLATEGASAFIVTTAERAKDCPRNLFNLGGSSEWYRQQYVDPARYDEVKRLGKQAFETTLIRQELMLDIDLFELYDINTWKSLDNLKLLVSVRR